MRKLPMIRTPVSALVMVLGFAVCSGLCLDPLTMPTGLMILYLAGPFMLPMALLLSGWLPAWVCLGISAGGLLMLFGLPGLAVGLVYLAPMLILFHVLCAVKSRFLTVLFSAVGVLILSQTALYVWVQLIHERQAFQRAAGAMTDWFLAHPEQGDLLLYVFNTSGLLPLSASFEGTGVINGTRLTEAARLDLLGTLSAMVIQTLDQMATSLVVGMSLYLGTLASFLPERAASAFQRRRARLGDREETNPPIPLEPAPPLHTWHLPRGWGWKVGILAAGYLLQAVSSGPVRLLGRIFFEVFAAVYSVQGVALINYLQVARGSRKGWRIAVPLLVCAIAPRALYIVGVFDQLLDPRHLRPREGQKEI